MIDIGIPMKGAVKVHVYRIVEPSQLASTNYAWVDPEGDRGSGPAPCKNRKTLGFLSNTGPDPLKITKLQSTKPEFNVGPSSALQRNAI